MLTKFLDWASEPPDRSRQKRTKTPRERWLTGVTIFCLTFVGGQTLFSGMTEGDCWFWPGIGTRFAPGYSAWGFESVRPGMTKAEVERLIGTPLGAGYSGMAPPQAKPLWRPGDETWTYSSDSSALGGDWAWLLREVIFRNGVVVQRVYWTYHD